MRVLLPIATLLLMTACATSAPVAVGTSPLEGWLQWRGPTGDGSSAEGDLPTGLEEVAWRHALPGRGTPVIAGDRLFAMGYEGTGADVVEVLVALDVATGERLWTRHYPDFLSDIIYERYSIGAPSVDPVTGHVYAMTSPGLLVAVSRDGAPLWERLAIVYRIS